MLFGAAPSNGLSHSYSRTRIPFSAINRKGQSGYNSELQKHHLLPCALERRHSLAPLINGGLRHHVDLHDFRINGVLLPATESQARRSKLPLHRGPHPNYSQMVEERIATIEASWCQNRFSNPISARQERLLRIDILIKALRLKILAAPRGKHLLNKHCPLGSTTDFTALDDMAELLWCETSDVPEREFEPA